MLKKVELRVRSREMHLKVEEFERLERMNEDTYVKSKLLKVFEICRLKSW